MGEGGDEGELDVSQEPMRVAPYRSDIPEVKRCVSRGFRKILTVGSEREHAGCLSHLEEYVRHLPRLSEDAGPPHQRLRTA